MFKNILLRQKKQPVTSGAEIAVGSHVCFFLGSEPLLLPDGEQLLAAEMNEERLKVMELIQIYEDDHLLLADGSAYLSIYKTY